MVTLALSPGNRPSLAGTAVRGREAGLVDRARAGDREAFQGLFQQHARPIYSLSLGLMKNVAAAENLTRDIFIKAFSNLDPTCDDAHFATWVNRIAITAMAARSPHRSSSSGFVMQFAGANQAACGIWPEPK